MSFVSQGGIGRGNVRLFFALIAVTLSVLVWVPHAKASGYVKLNVLMHFGVRGYTTNQVGSQTRIYDGEGFRPYRRAGYIVSTKNGEGVRLKLVRGEKLVNAYYDFILDGANRYFQHKWTGKEVLPLYKLQEKNGYKTPMRITDVYVEALLPSHPPFDKVPLK